MTEQPFRASEQAAERRLSPGAALAVIAALSVLLWAALIAVVRVVL